MALFIPRRKSVKPAIDEGFIDSPLTSTQIGAFAIINSIYRTLLRLACQSEFTAHQSLMSTTHIYTLYIIFFMRTSCLVIFLFLHFYISMNLFSALVSYC